MLRMKIPECKFCHYKMYVIENGRQAIGYLCPNCDFSTIHYPTEYWKSMRQKRYAEINRRSMSGSRPKFGSHRLDTKCSKCFMSKYVVCRKVKQTKKRASQGLSPLWNCVCTKCNTRWGQSHPKIVMQKIWY